MAKRRIEPATIFLNVDLEVWSRQPLGPLVEAFGELNLYHGPIGRKHMASFETTISAKTADATVRALVRRARALRGTARRLWDSATRRDFNIGLQSGAGPKSFEVQLAPATVRAIEEVHGGVVVTVYGAEVQPEAKKKDRPPGPRKRAARAP